MTTPPNGLVVRPDGEGLAVPNAAPGADMIVKALHTDTNGAYSLMEWRSAPGGAWIPPHIHQGAEEAWYVLEGELTFRVDDRTMLATAGSFVLVPRGAPHSFANTGSDTAHFLMLFSPGGTERFFEERAAIRRDAPPGGPDITALNELSRRYGIEWV